MTYSHVFPHAQAADATAGIVGAIRVHLRPIDDAFLPMGSARPLHAALHRMLETADADLAQVIHHEQMNRLAISPLHHANRHARPGNDSFRADEEAWFRLTVLERNALSGFLSGLAHHWMDHRPLQLDRQPFFITAVEPMHFLNNPAVISYDDIAATTPPANEVTMHFVTPVIFRNRGQFLTPDDPWRVFGSYLRRWQAFADVPFPAIREHSVRAGVSLVRTTPLCKVPLDIGFGRQIGFSGEVRFRIQGTEEFRHGISVLARYAAFCSTGSRTAFGLGQTVPHFA